MSQTERDSLTNVFEADAGNAAVTGNDREETFDPVPSPAVEEEEELLPEVQDAGEEDTAEEDTAEEDAGTSGMSGNPGMRSALRTLIGLYLMYLGYSIVRPVTQGESVGMPLWVAILFGVLFILAGGFFVYLQLRDYKKSKDRDDSDGN